MITLAGAHLVAQSSSSNDVAPGALGFLVVAAIALALVFLLRSMNKQFRKLPPPPEGTASSRPARGLRAHREAQAARKPQ